MCFFWGDIFSTWFFESRASIYNSCGKESYLKDLKKERIKLWHSGLLLCKILKIGSDLGLILWNLWIARDDGKTSRKWALTTLDWDGGKHLPVYIVLGDRINIKTNKIVSKGLFLILK